MRGIGFLVLPAAVLSAGCMMKYRQPENSASPKTEMVVLAKAELLRSAREELTDDGFLIERFDENAGTLHTGARAEQLRPGDADCGLYAGFDPVTDARTQMELRYVVTADEGQVAVQALMSGAFRPSVGAAPVPLVCVSKGTLEDRIIARIIDRVLVS